MTSFVFLGEKLSALEVRFIGTLELERHIRTLVDPIETLCIVRPTSLANARMIPSRIRNEMEGKGALTRDGNWAKNSEGREEICNGIPKAMHA